MQKREGCNDGSVEEEEDVSMLQLTDPSVLEERQDYEHEPTHQFSPQATMPPPSPQPHLASVISESGAVTSYLQPSYLPIPLDKFVNANGLNRSKCGPEGMQRPTHVPWIVRMAG